MIHSFFKQNDSAFLLKLKKNPDNVISILSLSDNFPLLSGMSNQSIINEPNQFLDRLSCHLENWMEYLMVNVNEYLICRYFVPDEIAIDLVVLREWEIDEDENCILKAVLLRSNNLSNDPSLLNKRLTELKMHEYILFHNLRSPLISILELAGLLNEEETEEVKKMARTKLSKCLDKVEVVLNDLEKNLNKELIDENEYFQLAALLEQTRLYFDLESSQFNCLLERNFFFKSIHKYFFENLLNNLVSNAVKYSSERKLKIKLSVFERKEILCFEFEDNGIGIDMAKNGQKLFRPKMRLYNDLQGIGLGLYMLKKHVELFGGHIDVISQIDIGTKFIIQLPPDL